MYVKRTYTNKWRMGFWFCVGCGMYNIYDPVFGRYVEEQFWDMSWKWWRQKANERKVQATNIWKKRVIFCSFLFLVTSGFLLLTDIWYAQILGLASCFIGLYGAFREQNEFIFVVKY